MIVRAIRVAKTNASFGPPMEREWEYIDGSLCNVNINCYSGHSIGKMCTLYEKCPNECSGTLSNPQGTCKYYNEFDAEIETCAMYDLKCRAVCDCLDGFYGMDCSISRRSDYESIRTMKESLCLDVYRTLNIQDLDGNVIAQRAETVNDALLDPNLITDLGFVHCSDFMIETIAKAPLEAASSAAIEGVYQALSIILEGDRLGYLPFTLIHNVTSLVDNSYHETWLAAGEENVPYIADNLRVQIVKDHYEKVSGEVYTMPLSELDREYDTTTPTAELISTVPNTDYKSLGVTTIQYYVTHASASRVLSYFVGVYYNLFDNEEPDDVVVSEAPALNNMKVDYATGQEYMESGDYFVNYHPIYFLIMSLFLVHSSPTETKLVQGLSVVTWITIAAPTQRSLCVVIGDHTGIIYSIGTYTPFQSTCRCSSNTILSEGLLSYRLYTEITEVRTPFRLLLLAIQYLKCQIQTKTISS